MTHPNEKIRKLEAIEAQLSFAIQSAGQAINELSKDKPSNKTVESNSTQFIRAIENVESEISKQITYLTQGSTGQPHEGSSYASQKTLHMAWHRLEHSRSRLVDLERLKTQHQLQLQQHQQQMSMHQQQMQPIPPQ